MDVAKISGGNTSPMIAGDVVVQVIDGDSGKIVRQIPSEEILRLTERLDEMRSLMFEAKA